MKRARSARFLLSLLLVYHSILLRGLKILCTLQKRRRFLLWRARSARVPGCLRGVYGWRGWLVWEFVCFAAFYGGGLWGR